MKLKIGTIESKKKEKTTEDNYTEGLSDEELEAMSIEANGETEDFDLEETEEKPEVVKETETDIKKAVNDVVIFDEVGINMSYIYKFTELFPKKKIVYHNYITKQFLEWYIKNVKTSLLKKLFIMESEYINPEQQEEVAKMINKRLQKEEIELEDVGTLASPKLVEKPIVESEAGTRWELETKEQIDAYEFILTEKWNAKERAKGIQQLDAIIEEQMRVKKCDLQQALNNILEGFTLVKKYYEKIVITGVTGEPKEEVITPKPKKEKKYVKARELSKSIKRFHDIKFLYNLMSEKMEFTESPTKEDIAYIKQIKELLDGDSTPKKKETNKETGKMAMDKFLEGGKKD